MEEGLDVTKEDDEQRTPLDLAVAAGNERILGLFERRDKNCLSEPVCHKVPHEPLDAST